MAGGFQTIPPCTLPYIPQLVLETSVRYYEEHSPTQLRVDSVPHGLLLRTSARGVVLVPSVPVPPAVPITGKNSLPGMNFDS